MSEDVVHEIILECRVGEDYYDSTPSHVRLHLSDWVVSKLDACRQAYNAAVKFFPNQHEVYSLEVGFRGFDYLVDRDSDEDSEESDEPIVHAGEGRAEWNDRWELAVVHVTDSGFTFDSVIKHTSVSLTSDTLTFAEYDDAVRVFRAKKMEAGLDSAMSSEVESLPKKSSGPSPL
jgi:hypothetical protein